MKINKILILTLSIFSLITFTGCKNEMMSYEGEEGVYFSVQYGFGQGDRTKWSYYPLSRVELINVIENEYVHYVRVAATGSIKSYDRQFKLVVEPDSTTAISGQNYDALPELHTIKAGDYFTDVPIKLRKHNNILVESKQIILQLLPTSDFTLSIPIWDSNVPGLYPNNEYPKFDNTHHAIIVSDFLSRPKIWTGLPFPNASIGTKETGNFGEFTAKKFKLMCEVMESKGRIISYADFASETTMPTPLLNVIKEEMAKYLTEKFDAGTPVLEEDGRLMYFMGVNWTSNIGVPYPKNN